MDIDPGCCSQPTGNSTPTEIGGRRLLLIKELGGR